MLNVFGKDSIEFGFMDCDEDNAAISVHPEWNLIFFVGEERTIIAYDMDRRKVHVITTLVIWYHRCRVMKEDMSRPYYLRVIRRGVN